MSRVLILSGTTGYQLRAFEQAGRDLGIELVYATDRCHVLDDPWADRAIAVRFDRVADAVAAIFERLGRNGLDGVIPLGDQAAPLAAAVARERGIAFHAPEAAMVAADKLLTRGRLVAAGLPTPWFTVLRRGDPLAGLAPRLRFPCVVKPRRLTGSRGVIRADDGRAFEAAVERVWQILDEPEVRALGPDAAGELIVEGYIEGDEFAVEGVLERGALRVFAIFDKPDPLVGPFFEETIYVTPSRLTHSAQNRLAGVVAHAVAVLGLREGPVHAECRLSAGAVFVLEVAPRPIGGLCARVLRFTNDAGASATLEGLLLRRARGEALDGWRREAVSAGVMMVPIPIEGAFRAVEGLEDARAIGGIDEVIITAKPGQWMRRLPEGASYLGFVFARAGSASETVTLLRRAHARLRVQMDLRLPLAPA